MIRSLELPLVLLFNGGRVMALPQGVSKATGLHQALDTLRLSPRNTLAIGDAENDHELLRLAEVGVAVEWGSEALRAAADVVLAGSGPAAVGRLRTQPCRERTAADRRRAPAGGCGWATRRTGASSHSRCKGRNVLVAGDAKSGKSWVAGLLCEQLITARLLRLRHRSRGRLPVARSVAGRHGPRRRRSATHAAGAPAGAPVSRSQRGHRSLAPAPGREDRIHPCRATVAQRNPTPDWAPAPDPPGRGALLPARCRRPSDARSRAKRLHRRHLLGLAFAA